MPVLMFGNVADTQVGLRNETEPADPTLIILVTVRFVIGDRTG
jgi:hypothetical protein